MGDQFSKDWEIPNNEDIRHTLNDSNNHRKKKENFWDWRFYGKIFKIRCNNAVMLRNTQDPLTTVDMVDYVKSEVTWYYTHACKDALLHSCTFVQMVWQEELTRCSRLEK